MLFQDALKGDNVGAVVLKEPPPYGKRNGWIPRNMEVIVVSYYSYLQYQLLRRSFFNWLLQ